MKRSHRKRDGRPATELIEEASHLLRAGPISALACYYLGSAPFVLGLLFFWADMSRNPFAPQRLAGAALGLAALFVWMKFWQVVFARKLRAYVAGEPPPAWNFARVRRVFIAQMVWQPLGLIVLPVALLVMLPAAWTYAFYQNLTALDDGEPTSLRALAKNAARLSALWPGQNHTALLILSLFALCVGLGWSIFCPLLPELGRMILGIRSVFTLGASSLLNTTFLAAMLGLTYLCVDPLAKTVYVLRCFYGASLQSGDDLKAELRGFSLRPVAAIFFLMFLTIAGSLRAQESTSAPPPPPPTSASPTSVAPSDLNRAIDDVIHKRKYTWRSPRETVAPDDAAGAGKNAFARFVERVWTWTKGAVKATAEWVVRAVDKLFGAGRRTATPGTGISWEQVRGLLLAMLALFVGLIIFFLLRLWRNKHRRPTVVEAEAARSAPDLTDENLSAEQLPEDGWTRLARELLERGEFRLALRAFYLASLAHLAGRDLISLAQFKSNREYEHELGRRGHSFPGLLAVFSENLSAFDRTWYGRHETTRDLVQRFAANVEKIKAGG